MSNLLPVGLFNKKQLSVLAASALVCSLAFPLATSVVHADALPQLTQLIKNNRDAVVHISVEVDSQANRTAEPEMFAFPDGQGLPKELEKFFRNMPRGMPQPRDAQAMAVGLADVLGGDFKFLCVQRSAQTGARAWVATPNWMPDTAA